MTNDDVKILVVDDDPDILFSTTRLLKKGGFDIISAETGMQALEMANNDHPDLILLDVELPDILGTDVCKKLKNDPANKKVYIMMLSGKRTSPDDQADGLDIGADGYVSRPVSNRELLSRINAMARLIRAERKCEEYILEIQQAMEEIKVLRGVLPICMHCKKIRDDKGYWNQIESYVAKHTDTEFSHSVCQECAKTYYPDIDIYDE